MAADLIAPGLSVRRFLDEMQRYYAERGLLEEQWWIGGYELGIAFPPDWVGAYYFDVWKDVGDDCFEPGFVSNYEANFYLPDGAGMAALIDTMVFEENDARFLHRIPAQLFVVE